MKSFAAKTVGRLWLICLMVFVPTLLLPGIVLGSASYPIRSDLYVNDYAGILDTASENTISDMFQDLMYESGIEAVVVTINSVHDYQTGDDTIESFATNLFNLWGIGDYQKDNGILILVAVNDRDCRIELGAGYGTKYDSVMQNVIDEHMIPYFTTGDYQTGIIEGSRNAIKEVRSKPFNFVWILVPIIVIVVLFFGLRVIPRINFNSSIGSGTGTRMVSSGEDSSCHSGGHAFHGRGHSSRGGGRSFGGGASGHW